MLATTRTFVDVSAIRQSTDLTALENIVEKGQTTFIEVGCALWRIREAELYKTTHTTWAAYCAQRWGWSPQHAHRLMTAAKVASPVGDGAVPTERHARELAKAPKERRLEVVEAAQEIGGDKPTSDDFREAREIVVEGKPKRKSIQNRRTPQWLFDVLNEMFGPFVLDAYSDHDNALCDWHYTKVDNGHEKPWGDVTFANPEFREMEQATAKAAAEGEEGRRSCVLAPVGCSQDWFHENAIRGTVWVPDCRINYDDAEGNPTGSRNEEGGADRDTMVLTFGPGHRNHSSNMAQGVFLVRRLVIGHMRP